VQKRINSYWSKRAEEFSANRLQDLKDETKSLWMDIIRDLVPDGNGMSALDVGTGAGFHAFVLADLGFAAWGVDFSLPMIEQAKQNADRLGYKTIPFCRMDAQALGFPDSCFDLVISRNVTWTLPDPQKAYAEWCRVLAPGGILINFDANYGQAFKRMDQDGKTSGEPAANQKTGKYRHQGRKMIRERNDIAARLYVCDLVRPQWDENILNKLGMTDITVNKDMGMRLLPEITDEDKRKGDRYQAPMFMISAIKDSYSVRKQQFH